MWINSDTNELLKYCFNYVQLTSRDGNHAWHTLQGQCRLAVLVKGVHVITVTVDTMYKFRTSTVGLSKICSETGKSRISWGIEFHIVLECDWSKETGFRCTIKAVSKFVVGSSTDRWIVKGDMCIIFIMPQWAEPQGIRCVCLCVCMSFAHISLQQLKTKY